MRNRSVSNTITPRGSNTVTPTMERSSARFESISRCVVCSIDSGSPKFMLPSMVRARSEATNA